MTTKVSENVSSRDKGTDNLKRFKEWIVEREAAGDWQDYARGDKLNRSEIAKECSFALAVVRQNPRVKEALAALEERLRGLCILGGSNTIQTNIDMASDAALLAVDRRIINTNGRSAQRVKELEEQNAVLRAEVRDLREKLAHFKQLDDHLCKTGRLLHL